MNDELRDLLFGTVDEEIALPIWKLIEELRDSDWKRKLRVEVLEADRAKLLGIIRKLVQHLKTARHYLGDYPSYLVSEDLAEVWLDETEATIAEAIKEGE
jgi:hypothetical protein